MPLPQVAFPGTIPSSPITYNGQTYTYANGYLKNIYIDALLGVATYTWRLYDYANAHLISDTEAELLGVIPEVSVVLPDIYNLMQTDAWVATLVAKNLGGALVASAYANNDTAAVATIEGAY